MTSQDDRWLWFIDDAPLQALLKAEGDLGTMKVRAASSPALVRAMSAHLEGRGADALHELKTAVAGGEKQPDVYVMLGQMQYEAQNIEDAAATYRKLREIDSSNAVAAYNAGVCLEKLSRWNDAAEAFQRATKLDAARREAWLGLGLCCLHQRRPEEALTAFSRYLEIDANHESALFGKAVALQMLRRFDEASAIYDRFRDQGEPTPELLTNLLALAVARKDNAALSRVAMELAKVRPGTRQADEALAYSAVIANDWETAASHLERLGSQDSLPEDWAYARAYSLWKCGKPDAAIKAIDELLKLKSNHGPSHLLRGVLLEEQGSLTEALTSYRRAVAQSPDSEGAWWNIARLSAADGRADACQQASKAILDRNRNSAEGWYAKGLAAIIDNQVADAAKAFSEALRVKPDWAEAQWNLGLSLLESGETAKSESMLRKAFASLEGQVSTEPLARAVLANGEPVKAFQFIEGAGGDHASPELLYNIGLSLQEQGVMESAETCYRRVIEKGSSFTDAHINLGHVLLATGRPADAESIWTQAAELEAAN
jgi:tetratricopeptide (TPR) repeat protein